MLEAAEETEEETNMVKIVTCLFLVLAFSSLGYARDIDDLEIYNFKFGVLSKDSFGKLMITEETTTFPNQEGLAYGFVYDFIKHKTSPIHEKVTLQLPSSPSIIRNLENRNILSSNKDRTIVANDSIIKDESGTWYFGVGIDKGDPSGKYLITIEHDGIVFKTIEYRIK